MNAPKLVSGLLAPVLLLPAVATMAPLSSSDDLSEFTNDVTIAKGWAQNSINAVIFRTHAVTTHEGRQYTSFYGPEGQVVMATRETGSRDWDIHETELTGNTRDAHNAICLAVDGKGYIHLSWDHHNHDLRYVRSLEPGSFVFSERLPMTGENESRVTYPEFFNLDDGGLLFMYRVGGSGRGDMLLNRYDPESREWRAVQHPLISGGGAVNAYTNQIAIDKKNRWHLSWNWRETGDVATNHDLLYAMSPDEGKTWYKSTGEEYELPISRDDAEVIAEIPQNSELINQCSMTVDAEGRPIVASYWRPADSEVPQFHIVWHDGETWRTRQVSRREEPFRLAGGGTRRIPISRPKVAVDREDRVYLIYRDKERGSRISVAVTDDPNREKWSHFDLTGESVDMWEPNFDKALWEKENIFHIFKQRVGQGQRETLEDRDPTTVSILEWNPAHLFEGGR